MTQQKVRATTLQQKFGFQDADLNTPAHDALMVWLDENVEGIILQRYSQRYPTIWTQEEIDAILTDARNELEQRLVSLKKQEEDARRFSEGIYKSYLQNYEDFKQFCENWNPGSPPARTASIHQKVWESPVVARNGFMVGFIDMKVTIEHNTVRVENGRWCEYQPFSTYEDVYLLEIKPMLQSVGELVRQIRMYQEYQQGTYIVVSPDDRFASILAGQGIEFIKAPRL